MKSFSYSYSTHIAYANPVTHHIVRLRCQPTNCYFQRIVSEQLILPRGFWWRQSTDAMGASILQGGMRQAHDTLSYTSQGIVEHTSSYVIPDNSPHPMYRLPSAMTAFSPDMQVLLIERTRDFLADCLNICHNVWQWMEYAPGVTTFASTAHDAFMLRQGVCQDYAHVMISLCRACGIPARYVCGLMEGEGATHAWVEAHDGMCWYAFDPTNDTAISYNYIRITHGRDACDCAVSRGSFKGITSQTTNINVTVKEIK